MNNIDGKKVNILGTEYEIVVQTPNENPKLEDANGLCEFWAKKIIIDIAKPNKTTFDNLDEFNKKVLRHEIIHAFFGESGLKEYMQDETLVDWMAVQFPKILKAFEELELLSEKEKCVIHCGCTDSEIAKSFIEDVRAVKDLLPQEREEA